MTVCILIPYSAVYIGAAVLAVLAVVAMVAEVIAASCDLTPAPTPSAIRHPQETPNG